MCRGWHVRNSGGEGEGASGVKLGLGFNQHCGWGHGMLWFARGLVGGIWIQKERQGLSRARGENGLISKARQCEIKQKKTRV